MSRQVDEHFPRKFDYSKNTIVEVEKVLVEIHAILEYKIRLIPQKCTQFFVYGLSTRKNMCIHPVISQAASRKEIDSECRKITFVSPKRDKKRGQKKCSFFERIQTDRLRKFVSPGVYALHNFRQLGRLNEYCPYFLAMDLLPSAHINVFDHHFLMTSKEISYEHERDNIIIIDDLPKICKI
jgi:DNA excision repair protein ERCC-2